MAKFQIPQGHTAGFDAILNLNSGEFEELATLVKEIPIGTSSKTFFKQITNRLRFKGKENVAATLYSLPGLLALESTTNEEVAEEIADSYRESKESNGIEVPESIIKDLSKKLLLLFSNFGNLITTYKAIVILTTNDKIYRDSRILSDIRLVFNDDIQEPKRNAVIIHKLKIEYKNDNIDKEIFVSLDSSDLKELKSYIDRALEKERIIKQDYSEVVTFIDIN
jgi:hypothetical protein